jgi:hypothetical protein
MVLTSGLGHAVPATSSGGLDLDMPSGRARRQQRQHQNQAEAQAQAGTNFHICSDFFPGFDFLNRQPPDAGGFKSCSDGI